MPRSDAAPIEALLSGKQQVMLALRATDQCHADFLRNVIPHGGQAGARYEKRYAHLRRLDDHFRMMAGTVTVAGRAESVSVSLLIFRVTSGIASTMSVSATKVMRRTSRVQGQLTGAFQVALELALAADGQAMSP